jgi:hypothetical protein
MRDMAARISIEANGRVHHINAVVWHGFIRDLLDREHLARDRYGVEWTLRDLDSGEPIAADAIRDETRRPTDYGLRDGARLRLLRSGHVERA